MIELPKAQVILCSSARLVIGVGVVALVNLAHNPHRVLAGYCARTAARVLAVLTCGLDLVRPRGTAAPITTRREGTCTRFARMAPWS